MIQAWTGRLLHIEPDRLQRILAISLPIIGGMLSQSVINLIDAAMVGRLGDQALAAVGIGSYAAFIMVSLVMGISSAVQSLVARRQGAGDTKRLNEPFMAGLQLAVVFSIPLSLLLILAAPVLIPLLTDDPEVAAIAVPYFQWRAAALIAVAMNFVYRGFWAGIGETRFYLRILLIMHLANVAISYLLIFGMGSWEGVGPVGSGMGTAVSLVLGSGLYTWLTFRRQRHRLGNISLPNRTTLRQLITLAGPNSLQQTLFAFGISVFFWIIGQISTQAHAIGHILISLQLLLILPAVGMGIASTSLVGHALGAGKPTDAHRSGWEVVRVTILIMLILGAPLWMFPEAILTVFTNDPQLIELGVLPLRLTGLVILLEVTAMVLTQALLGAGASKQVMRINLLMQWCVLLPLAYLIGPVAGFGLLGVWILQGLQRIVLSLIYSLIWQRRQWTSLIH
ncbi:MAG: MATE family efflux transporter [Oceanobacter sp.]